MKVLIAEDEAISRGLLTEAVERAGHQAVAVTKQVEYTFSIY